MMSVSRILNTCAIVLIAGCANIASTALADTESDPNARDLLILTDWFEGEFDNEEQLWFERDPRSNTPEDDRHQRVHTIHKRMDADQFGEHVFYVEEYSDHDPTNVFRIRIVIFSSDPELGKIRMQQGFFRDVEGVKGAHTDPEKFTSLTPDDVFFLDTCDVYWTRVADQFEGRMNEKTCVFGEGDKRRYSVHNLTLSDRKYWREDLTYLVADDSYYSGTKPGHPTKLRKVDQFLCMMSFRSEDGVQEVHDVPVHSQGGTAEVIRESDGQSFTMMIRQKEYPFYSVRPDFMFFSVRETGEFRSVAYAVTDTDARVVGINSSGIAAHCHRKGYEFRESLAELNAQN